MEGLPLPEGAEIGMSYAAKRASLYANSLNQNNLCTICTTIEGDRVQSGRAMGTGCDSYRE